MQPLAKTVAMMDEVDPEFGTGTSWSSRRSVIRRSGG